MLVVSSRPIPGEGCFKDGVVREVRPILVPYGELWVAIGFPYGRRNLACFTRKHWRGCIDVNYVDTQANIFESKTLTSLVR
jgi:hypothetical protein